MFDGRWRKELDAATRPVGQTLRRIGLTADHLTALGLGLAVATAVAIATGHLFLGLVLLAASALPDMLDGAVAKASGMASPRGAFFDSVADRVTDSLVLGGIAWYLASDEGWGGRWPLLAMAVMGTSTLISYQRAKAEALGYNAKGGLMERAERIVALAVGLAFPVLLVPILWVMLALTTLTAVQRFVKVWRQADAPVRPPRPERLGEARWRTAWQSRMERRAPRPRHRADRRLGDRWRRPAPAARSRRHSAGPRPPAVLRSVSVLPQGVRLEGHRSGKERRGRRGRADVWAKATSPGAEGTAGV